MGYHASMAHMVLWVNICGVEKEKKIIWGNSKTNYEYLYLKIQSPRNFNKSAMIIGLSGQLAKSVSKILFVSMPCFHSCYPLDWESKRDSTRTVVLMYVLGGGS
jgi:hypothetical protein